jgi:serine/threonine protein kinase
LKPLFPGNASLDVCNAIVKIVGAPPSKIAQRFNEVGAVTGVKRRTKQPIGIDRMLPGGTPADLVDLLLNVLVYDPTKRLSAEECRQHKCFDILFSSREILMPNGRPIPDLDRTPIGSGK